jgi:hypothetical protein
VNIANLEKSESRTKNYKGEENEKATNARACDGFIGYSGMHCHARNRRTRC